MRSKGEKREADCELDRISQERGRNRSDERATPGSSFHYRREPKFHQLRVSDHATKKGEGKKKESSKEAMRPD